MSAPHRIPKSAFILVPALTGMRPEDVVAIGRAAGRAALISYGLEPICPSIHYWPFLTPEEMDKWFLKLSLKWLRRCSCIWVCREYKPGEDDPVELDHISFKLLMLNEGLIDNVKRSYDVARRVVKNFSVGQDGTYQVEALSRPELASLLRCNISDGLLRGID